MLEHTLPSIEQFAAFLDGNLSQNEMRQFSLLAEQDGMLHRLLDANMVVDNTIAGFTDSESQLPSEIVGSEFELPVIPEEGVSQYVNLLPEPMDEYLVAASCANADISMFSDVNQDEHLTLGGDIHDDSSLTVSEDNGFDNSDDLSNSFSDDI